MEESEDSSSFENPERRFAKLSGQCACQFALSTMQIFNLPKTRRRKCLTGLLLMFILMEYYSSLRLCESLLSGRYLFPQVGVLPTSSFPQFEQNFAVFG
jgi:hypothetical protein